MAKHKFLLGLGDEHGNVVGTQCVRCGQILFYVNGVVPDDILAQECHREDVNQAAARTLREATERL